MKVDNKAMMPKVGKYIPEEKEKKNSELSVDDFLKILAAEISNQSITGSEGSGGSKTDYMTQLTQLTTLEQMNDIGSTLNTLNFMNQHQYAFSLIGKEVKLIDPETEEQLVGTVDKVKFEAGFAVLEVEGKNYFLGSVIEVTNK